MMIRSRSLIRSKSMSVEAARAAFAAVGTMTFRDAETDVGNDDQTAFATRFTENVVAAASKSDSTGAKRRAAVAEVVSKLVSSEMKPTRYRIWFLSGILDVIVTSFWLGSNPHTFYKIWLLKLSIIMGQRVYVFARRRMLLFLLSLCYVCSVAAMVHVLYFLDSVPSTKAIFAVGMGPMAGTALLMKNRLVIHEWNSLALLFIHWGLGLMVWTLRWYPPPALHTKSINMEGGMGEWNAISFHEYFVMPSVLYMAWAASYFAIVNVLLARWIERNKYDTQYSKALEGGMGVISKITNVFPRPLRPLSFLLAQYLMYAPPLLYVPLAWRYYSFGLTLLVIILGIAAWHGSGVHLKSKLSDAHRTR